VHAKAVARHLGTDHNEQYITPQEAQTVIPSLARIWDEPFSDSSQIPTLLVATMARKHVTVCLSGDAGDEIFGGYNRYFWAQRIWQLLDKVPFGIRRRVSDALLNIRPARLRKVFDKLQELISLPIANPSDKIFKLAELLQIQNSTGLYLDLVSHWKQPDQVVIDGKEPPSRFLKPLEDGISYIEKMMYWDLVTYLPDDNLVKVDRASMSVSLETRVPFLDHTIIEFAWGLPLAYKVQNGVGKKILRSILYKYVPRELIDRPKMGFGVPIDSWLRGPLRDWAENLLDEDRLKRDGFFRPELIRKRWQEHVDGKRNWQYHLWDILMFQAWMDENSSSGFHA